MAISHYIGYCCSVVYLEIIHFKNSSFVPFAQDFSATHSLLCFSEMLGLLSRYVNNGINILVGLTLTLHVTFFL